MNYSFEEVQGYNEGDVVKLNGKNYKLYKKTSTAISVGRYYWFDAVGEWLVSKLGRKVTG